MIEHIVKSPSNQQRRFIQLLITFFLASVVGMFIANPKSQLILAISAIVMLLLLWLVKSKQNYNLAINGFLWLITIQISALISNNNASYNPIVICYALVLVYAALFSSRRVFPSLTVFIALYCSSLLLAIMLNFWPAPTPRVSPTSVFAINLYLWIAGLTAWVIARDYRTLLTELRLENLQAEQSKQALKQLASEDGFELSMHINKTYPDTKIIISSGYNNYTQEIHDLNSERIHYIAKPYKISELMQLLRKQ